MFKTVQQSAMFEGGPRGPDGVQLWSHVENEIWPWFYVEVLQGSSLEGYRSMLMLPNIYILEEVIAAQTEYVVIDKLYIVSPPGINGSFNWKMEVLSKIEVSRTNGGALGEVICTVDFGARYSLSDVQSDLGAGTFEIIYAR